MPAGSRRTDRQRRELAAHHPLPPFGPIDLRPPQMGAGPATSIGLSNCGQSRPPGDLRLRRGTEPVVAVTDGGSIAGF